MKHPHREAPGIPQVATPAMAFLLLIFFIATMTFEHEAARPAEPADTDGMLAPPGREAALTVRATAGGALIVEGREVALVELESRIADRAAGNAIVAVTIETDGDAARERMIRLLDDLRAAGATRFSIRRIEG